MNKKIIHHGNCSGQFEPICSGTDYFYFRHKPCQKIAHITAVLLDEQARIIFNLKCPECGFRDAVKTTPGHHSLNLFHISPCYRKNIHKHWWDNL